MLPGLWLAHRLPLYGMMWPVEATRILPSMLHTSLRAVGVLLLVLTAAGCESLLPSFYTVPVRQGNYIDPTMVAQLRPGMTRQQVQRIMGTPLVEDPFHQNRWDYYYQYGQGGKISEQRRVTVFFRGETLDRVDEALN